MLLEQHLDLRNAPVSGPPADDNSISELTGVPWRKGRYDNQGWRRSAACAELDPRMFFPVGTTGHALDEIAEAKAVCAHCPVRTACLQFALSTNQEFGVWGGKDEDERRSLRRRWRAAARA